MVRDTPGQEEDNMLVERATKRPILVLEGAGGAQDPVRYHSAHANWSADSTMLLWTVDGKWFPDYYTLVKIKDDQPAWKLDLLKTLQQTILQLTRKAAPAMYAIKKAENAGNGSAYPEGFTVYVSADQDKTDHSIRLPLAVHAALTSNNKDLERRFTLESELDGVVDEAGKFKATGFKLLRPGKARQ